MGEILPGAFDDRRWKVARRTDVNAVDVIRTKRDGGRISDEQIRWFLAAYTAGEIPDEQASALLMAILFRGMADDELATWTAAMIDSGERLDLSAGRPPDRRQALDRRRRRQGVARAVPARGRVRGRGAAAVGARPRSHRRHARQDGVDPGLAGGAVAATRCVTQLPTSAAVISAAGAGLAPGRPQALRAARRHRHGRVDPAHRAARSCRRRSPRAPRPSCST